MSWFNPSPDEAADEYVINKNKYYEAANQWNASVRQEQNYCSQKSAAQSQINNLSNDKINFEKRLEGIEEIISMLEGTGGWFKANVPEAISKAVSSIQKTDESYHSCIRMTGGIAAASLENAFKSKSVDADSNSAAALQAYKTEKARLEQAIIDIKNQLASLSAQVATLSSQISACNATQSSLKHIMNSCAYEMNHYKNYMY